MRSNSSIVYNGAFRKLELPWIVNANRWRKAEMGWIVDGAKWKPLWDPIDIPSADGTGVFVSGRWGNIPGTIWGSTLAYVYWRIPTVKRVVGIQIRIDVSKTQGSLHGTAGRWGIGNDRPPVQWEAQPWENQQVSPYLACNFAPGEEIRAWIYGNDNEGDGKTYRGVRIENLYYED